MPIWAVDPDGMRIKFVGSLGNKIRMKLVLRFIRRNSDSFNDLYKKLKTSSNVHTVYLLEPIKLSKMTKDQIETHNRRRFHLDPFKHKKQERGELLESEKTFTRNANGKNAAVISDSELHNDWLKNNNKLTDENKKEDDRNGVGEGSSMVYGVKEVSNRGELYELEGESSNGISRIAHEFKHMSDIDQGILEKTGLNEQEKQSFRSKGIGEKTLGNTIKSEIRAVDYQNDVSKEVSGNTGKNTTLRSEY